MDIVEAIQTLDELNPKYSSWKRETLTLSWEERRKSHGKRTSDNGISFGISFPSGTLLRDGDCLLLESAQTIIIIREAIEEVYVLKPESSKEFAYLAYQVGNRHQALMITDNELICLQEIAIKGLLDQLEVNYTCQLRPFTGVLNVSSHSH